MQVNRATFPAAFPHFVSLLETCDFYALDEEMTGINVPEVVESITDSPAASYASKRQAATRYSIMQCGICLFHRVPAEASVEAGESSPRWHYVARPFNFVLFPHAVGEAAEGEPRAADLAVSPSAFAFLQQHGMDFQSWVHDGIPFCDRHQEAAHRRARAAAQAEGAVDVAAMRALLLDGDKAWLDEAMATAEGLAARAAASASSSAVDVATVARPVHSRAARDCLRACLSASLPTVSLSFRRPPANTPATGPALFTAVLTAIAPAELARRAAQEALAARRAEMDVVGFRHVFSALVKSRKPCVGHNCFADWLFLLAALDGPLPATLPLLKGRLHDLFPCVFDTKYMSARTDVFAPGRFASTHLGGLFAQYDGALLSPRVCVTLPLGFESYDPLTLLLRSSKRSRGGPAHEAGYDALMTGAVFANLLHEAGATLEGEVAEAGEAGLGFANKLALFRSLYAVDLASPRTDAYMPGAAFLLTHGDGVRAQHVESCLETSAWRAARVYAVDEATSVAAFPTATATLPVPTLADVQAVVKTYATVHPMPVESADSRGGVAPSSVLPFAASEPSVGLLRGTVPRLFFRKLLTRH